LRPNESLCLKWFDVEVDLTLPLLKTVKVKLDTLKVCITGFEVFKNECLIEDVDIRALLALLYSSLKVFEVLDDSSGNSNFGSLVGK